MLTNRKGTTVIPIFLAVSFVLAGLSVTTLSAQSTSASPYTFTSTTHNNTTCHVLIYRHRGLILCRVNPVNSTTSTTSTNSSTTITSQPTNSTTVTSSTIQSTETTQTSSIFTTTVSSTISTSTSYPYSPPTCPSGLYSGYYTVNGTRIDFSNWTAAQANKYVRDGGPQYAPGASSCQPPF